MAKNFVQNGHQISAIASYPTTPASGDPVVVGTIPGVAVTDESAGGNPSGYTTIATKGVFALEVVGHDGSTDAAVGLGARVYYDSGIAGLNVNSGGVLYGKALEAVEAGETGTIPILLIQA